MNIFFVDRDPVAAAQAEATSREDLEWTFPTREDA